MEQEKRFLFALSLVSLLLVTLFSRMHNVESYLNGLSHLSHHAKDYDQDGDKDSHRPSHLTIHKVFQVAMLPIVILKPVLRVNLYATTIYFSYLIKDFSSGYSFTIFRPPINR